MKGKTIAVLCPGEQFSSRWNQAWSALLGHLIVNHELGVFPYFDFCSNVYTTRNMMSEFIQESFPQIDYVLWIDDDNPLRPEQFDRLWVNLKAQRDAAAVAGWAWCESDQFECGALISAGRINPDYRTTPFSPEEIIGRKELIPCDYTGFASILMHGETLRKAGKNAFSPYIDPIFEHGYSGEDYAFCRHAKERAGLKFYVDPLCQVPHLKLRAITPTRLLKLNKECAA